MKISFYKVTIFLFLAACGSAWASTTEIIPHRGGRAEFPENTIPAFKECIKLGAKTLEFDIQVTKDGVAVVYHPGDLSVNTNGKGRISDYSFADIKKLDAAYLFKQTDNFLYRGQGYTIPAFEEVITTFPETKLILDLKSLPADTLINSIVEVLNKYKAWERAIFCSTSNDHLNYLKENYPQAKTFASQGTTLEEILTPAGSSKIQATNDPVYLGFELVRDVVLEEALALGKTQYPIKLQCWNRDNISRIRQKLTKSYIVMFGINTINDYEKAIELGADAIYSDNPRTLFQYSVASQPAKLLKLGE